MHLPTLVAASLLCGTASAASGTFDILTFNVAGLPAFLQGNGQSGDKTANTKLIGSKFAQNGYDIIHVQEVSRMVLDSFHQLIISRISTTTPPYTLQTTTLTVPLHLAACPSAQDSTRS